MAVSFTVTLYKVEDIWDAWRHGVGHLPVIRATNGNRKVVGILSQSDIMSAYNHALEERGLMAKLRPSKT